MSDNFSEHLKNASSIVRAWPAWKQTILGGEAGMMTEAEKAMRLALPFIDEASEMQQALGRLRESLKKEYGLTLRRFSELAGVSPVDMSRWTAEPIDSPPDFIN